MAYQRRPPPLPMQIGFGFVMERVVGPILRRQERRGTAGRFFARQHEIQEKRIRRKNQIGRAHV